jgi:hypothetical protein
MKVLIFFILTLAVGYYLLNQNNIKINGLDGSVPKTDVSKTHIQMPKLPLWKRTNTDIKSLKLSTELPKQLEAINKLTAQEIIKYDGLFIDEAFKIIKNRPASHLEREQWVNVFSQGGAREGLFRAITLDQEYFELEEIENYFERASQEKILRYYQTFLGRSYDIKQTENISKMKFKKMMIERFLEIIDLFLIEDRLDDLFKWYSLLSVDLANEIKNTSQNKTRINLDPLFHYQWAQRVPFQHLKGEVILKLGLAINEFN